MPHQISTDDAIIECESQNMAIFQIERGLRDTVQLKRLGLNGDLERLAQPEAIGAAQLVGEQFNLNPRRPGQCAGGREQQRAPIAPRPAPFDRGRQAGRLLDALCVQILRCDIQIELPLQHRMCRNDRVVSGGKVLDAQQIGAMDVVVINHPPDHIQ